MLSGYTSRLWWKVKCSRPFFVSNKEESFQNGCLEEFAIEFEACIFVFVNFRYTTVWYRSFVPLILPYAVERS